MLAWDSWRLGLSFRLEAWGFDVLKTNVSLFIAFVYKAKVLVEGAAIAYWARTSSTVEQLSIVTATNTVPAVLSDSLSNIESAKVSVAVPANTPREMEWC